ncbi:ABC transporter permease [Streptomyces morookaense]|uniref:ABC transporter permease n=1 Tax=Streptomyces morookaense TaxID=1970 RepID=A0A7Y7B7P6_STRMO|nr:ABC transporter permease [Streptomyces morookaense]NVK80517.1 ABC transporter permease [Streptomyces morookaense]GHF46922.1 ABC transporter membrane-spanning protein [Streptomyces morookaense]
MTAVATAPAPARHSRLSGRLAGTGALLRLALRRDRLMLPVWILALGGTLVSGAGTLAKLYDTAAKRADLAESMNGNSSLRALYGPVFADSLGALNAWRLGGFMAVLAAVMSLMIVVRHTRDEEETGRQELLSSACVGRHAPLASALLTALLANAGVALITTAGLAKSTGTTAGSAALGLAVGATGMAFAGVAAITAQLTESGRLAKGLAGAVLGAAFVLRAAGDTSSHDASSVLDWLSPLGWAENVRPYAGERWWALLLLVAAAGAQSAVAYALAGRRDIGMGLVPPRPGPAEGRMATAYGLAWRLQRGALTGWAAGFAVAGLLFGGMTKGATRLLGDNEQTKEMFRRMGGQSGLTNAYLAAIVGLLGMVAALYAAQSVLRLHGEETGGRAEPVLANAVGRLPWAAGHLVIAFGGSVLLMTVGGLGLAAGYGEDFGRILGAALVQVPAIWVLAGLAVLLYGAFPKAAPATWGVVGVCLALGWIGPALNLPRAALDLSPFGHLPKLPGTPMHWLPVLSLLALAAALVGAGLAALRRRDISG